MGGKLRPKDVSQKIDDIALYCCPDEMSIPQDVSCSDNDPIIANNASTKDVISDGKISRCLRFKIIIGEEKLLHIIELK